MDELRFVDTTLSAARQSLWAESKLTEMILPIAVTLGPGRIRGDQSGGAVVIQKACCKFIEEICQKIRLVQLLAPSKN